MIVIGTIFLFTSDILALDTSKLKNIIESDSAISISKKYECTKLYDDYIEYETKIYYGYYDYLSERTGVDKEYLIEQVVKYGSSSLSELDEKYRSDYNLKVLSEGVYDEDSPSMKFSNISEDCFEKLDEWIKQSDHYDVLKIEYDIAESFKLKDFDMPELYEFPDDAIFGIDFHKDIKTMEHGTCKSLNQQIHHSIGQYESAYDILEQSYMKENLESMNDVIQRLDRLVKELKGCDVMVPQFYVEWVNTKN